MPDDKAVKFIHELPAIRAGLEHLIAKDKVFKKRGIDLKTFDWPYMRPGFEGLVRIVVGQQVSTAAAASLWKRFKTELGAVTPKKILALSPEDMRALGMSRQKASYITGLAEAVAEKRLNMKALEAMDNDAAAAAITALKGLGPWSAHMYLMFSLGRPDIWPHGDLGIQEGIREYLGLEKRPSAEETREHGRRFGKHTTAASLLLWRIKD